MLFLTAFVVPIFLHFLRYYVKFLNFGTSFGTQLGPKWHHKSAKWVQKAKKKHKPVQLSGDLPTDLLRGSPPSALKHNFRLNWVSFLWYSSIRCRFLADSSLIPVSLSLSNVLRNHEQIKNCQKTFRSLSTKLHRGQWTIPKLVQTSIYVW